MNLPQIKAELLSGECIPRIIGREHMLCSAVLIPLILTEEEPLILFQRRSAQIRQGGEICFPGGRFDKEKDSDFKMTALRETCEEIGIQAEKVEILGSPGTLVTPLNVLVQPYLGILNINGLSDLSANEEEVEELFTLSLSWFAENSPQEYRLPIKAHPFSENQLTGDRECHFPTRELDLPERYQTPWEGENRHRIWAYSTPQGLLWGITAQILVEILPLLMKD
ncbi:CoA pyrophosphatase [Oceanispirochaeta sp.]|jgi:coenzyme A diphosphatase NUDT7|uniref:NUDIX hydrolase n=1 Tax=Oceanispirochaeta sp. TaxID=2035350 RepID=UPI00261F8CB9|nr:CoA pyrophosphatase [Oceanispirochaeta sp.]MDA3955479.1 CoA pyrophosphatase [Oceanispirochaeta sp.]